MLDFIDWLDRKSEITAEMVSNLRGLLGVAAGLAGQIHEILRKYLRYSGLKIGGRVCGHGFRYTLDVKTHESATCASLGSTQAVWFDVRDVRMGAECFQGRFRRRFVSNLDPSAIMKTHGKLSE